MGKQLKVLSIDGGGTRGLMPSTMLHCLEQETGQLVTDMFDVIVGSATGGIIAASLAAGMKTEEIIDIYLNRASYILPSNFFRKIWNPVNLFAPKYPNKNLKQLLQEKFGAQTTLTDVSKKYGTDTIFLLLSLDYSPELAPGEAPSFKIVIYNSILTKHQNENLTDLALRTSSAVVNLPIYQHYGEGGNYANDPALAAFSFCLNSKKGDNGESLLPENMLGLDADIEDIKILSLGCGMDGGTFIPKNEISRGNWGLVKWINRLTSLVIDTGMVYTQYLLGEIMDANQYLRINPYYKSDDAPAILRNEKLRIDVRKKEHLEAIKQFAEFTFEQESERIKNFLV